MEMIQGVKDCAWVLCIWTKAFHMHTKVASEKEQVFPDLPFWPINSCFRPLPWSCLGPIRASLGGKVGDVHYFISNSWLPSAWKHAFHQPWPILKTLEKQRAARAMTLAIGRGSRKKCGGGQISLSSLVGYLTPWGKGQGVTNGTLGQQMAAWTALHTAHGRVSEFGLSQKPTLKQRNEYQ